jgi:hypothetical protein
MESLRFYLHTLYNRLLRPVHFNRVLVRNFLEKDDDDIVFIDDWGHQVYPDPNTHFSFWTRREIFGLRCRRYTEITLYAWEGPADNVTLPFLDKIVMITRTGRPVYIRELKQLLIDNT